VLTIVYQKNSPDRLYIGTDLGVFVTDNGSNYWELLGAEMPNMIINELEIMENTNKLRACTYGRGIWETDLLTCNPTKINISSDSPDELCDGEVVTLTAEGNSDKYLWSNGETTKSIKVTETGYYSVAIPKDWGCSDKSEPKKVTFKQVPALTISVSGNLPLCGDDASVVFRAPYDFETYQWSNGATDRRIEISEPGIYYLSAETSNGCTAYSDTIVVEKYDLADVPTINRFSTDTLISSEAASYKWYKNGKIISGQNEQKLFISGDGDYSVQIVNDNGCSATSEDFPVNDLSIEELIEQGVLSVSENPSNGLFSISFNKNIENTVIVNVVNTLGELINKQYFDFASQGQMIEIDLRNQSKGMYFLNLTIGETQSMMKLIIQ
jgi:hypothetical protein